MGNIIEERNHRVSTVESVDAEIAQVGYWLQSYFPIQHPGSGQGSFYILDVHGRKSKGNHVTSYRRGADVAVSFRLSFFCFDENTEMYQVEKVLEQTVGVWHICELPLNEEGVRRFHQRVCQAIGGIDYEQALCMTPYDIVCEAK